MFVPAWDFDYAYTVDFETDLDSSAAAIAAAGLVRLVAAMGPDDPDYADFLAALEGTLLNLSAAPFLTNDEGPEMSILRHGSYHHFASLEPSSSYDNGLIWGDYFFIDAILAYRALRATSVIVPAAPVVYLTAPGTALSWQAQSAVIYQVETSNDLQIWTDQGLPFAGIEGNVEAALPNSTQPRYWRLRAWSQGLQE
ncbi:MAG: hypothetical protein JJT96_14100 [Opitutales bacterium]|nr:hypothetical protein [Opitutales bacterium]